VKKATATAALATTGDCNVFWLTACALAATPKWVIDSGASHHMCKDRSSYSMFKKLSLPIVIEVRDNNWVTITNNSFVNVIQGYQVEALHTRTFWLSLLLINLLDLGGYTTIFQNGKCSITSHYCYNFVGKLINGIYIIVPTTALLATIEKGKKRKWESSLSRVLITEPINAESSTEPTIQSSETPTIASTNPPASSELSAPPTAKTRSTRKSRTISESRLWPRPLAHMNSTTMKSLIDRYTHDDFMCTVCIQANHKQRISRVPVKCTMKPLDLVHCDVCSPFSTPSLGDNRYYILFIDDYTRNTSIWLLRKKTSKGCTSTYQSFQARVESMGYEIKQFRCDNGMGEYDNKNFQYALAACGTAIEPCPPYAHNKNGVAEWMIHSITEKAWAMMINSQAPIQFWGETVNTAVNLH